jgi:quercetin dioxygenase-like cupin family protein
MQNIKQLPAKELAPGLTGYYTHGSRMTLGLVEIKAGSVLPKHQHEHEQITYMIEGQLDMNIDGVDYSLTPGSYHVIPSNVWHGATAITDCKLIDVFSPVREEYKNTSL